jgi:hypothetical protein
LVPELLLKTANLFSDDVVKDFCERIKHYELQYETIDEETESDYSFIKVPIFWNRWKF